MNEKVYDVAVIGSGPAGQQAALQAANAGLKTALIEKDRMLGGACVYRGTIPSKTLRENALRISEMRKIAQAANLRLPRQKEMAILLGQLDTVLQSHHESLQRRMQIHGVDFFHGRASFADTHRLRIEFVGGDHCLLRAGTIVIATGSRPRNPPELAIDHENILDSDSILSLVYLPESLTVLGSGVIACEYASIFQALGVRVTLVDSHWRPLRFLDPDLSKSFVAEFESQGGQWRGGVAVQKTEFDGVSQVVVTLQDGERIVSEKLLCAVGREANLEDLRIENAGLTPGGNNLIPVNEHLQCIQPNILAAGDVIGAPSLASASMEQGRRAICHVTGNETPRDNYPLATGIYSIPELACVGMSESEARKRFPRIMVGRAHFHETAKGRITGCRNGFLKLIADASGRRLLGVGIVGPGATELVHIGQMALIQHADVDLFVNQIFNFPTLAEAYREAALKIIAARSGSPDTTAFQQTISEFCSSGAC